MRLKATNSKNTTNYYIIKDYIKNNKRSTKIVDKIGNTQKITELANKEGVSFNVWLNNYLQNYIKEHSVEKEIVLIKKNSKKQISKNEKRIYNVGYLFLENIYYKLKLNEICEYI